MKNFIVCHYFYLSKKWDKANFFSTYKSFLSEWKQAPRALFFSFCGIFLHDQKQQFDNVYLNILSCHLSAVHGSYQNVLLFYFLNNYQDLLKILRTCFDHTKSRDRHVHTKADQVDNNQEYICYKDKTFFLALKKNYFNPVESKPFWPRIVLFASNVSTSLNLGSAHF